MKYTELFLGLLLGLLTAFLGASAYSFLFTEFNLFSHFTGLMVTGMLGKVLKLGAVLNLGVFFLLLKFNKDQMAKGIIVAFVLITVLAFFI